MNRSAKGLQVAEGILLIAAQVFLALPFYIIRQENYADQVTRPYELIIDIMSCSMEQRVFISVLLILPLALSLVLGLAAVVRKQNHLLCILGNAAVVGLYAAFLVMADRLTPELRNAAQSMERSPALYVPVACSVLALILGIVSLVLTPQREQQNIQVAASLDGLDEIRQRQNIPVEFTDESGNVPQRSGIAGATIPGAGRMVQSGGSMAVPVGQPVAGTGGVLIGLDGIFAGAEIPLADGEPIRLGRDTSNHLVFTDQQKVSRNHCVITWLADKRKYQIKDTSSNGSFVNGNEEEPIPQNIPVYLESGTVLDIGDSSNRFRLG